MCCINHVCTPLAAVRLEIQRCSCEPRWLFADTERLISLKIRRFGLSNMCTEIKPCLGELLFPAAVLRLPHGRRQFNENAFRKQ